MFLFGQSSSLYMIYAVYRYRILTEDLGIGLKVNEWKIAAIQADLGGSSKKPRESWQGEKLSNSVKYRRRVRGCGTFDRPVQSTRPYAGKA